MFVLDFFSNLGNQFCLFFPKMFQDIRVGKHGRNLPFNVCVHSSVVDTEDQTILLDAAIDDDHDNDGDDEEKKKDNIDGCMALSCPFCQLGLLLCSPVRKFTQVCGRETGEIRSRHHAASRK